MVHCHVSVCVLRCRGRWCSGLLYASASASRVRAAESRAVVQWIAVRVGFACAAESRAVVCDVGSVGRRRRRWM